jgi:hypothetical protein
LYNLVINSADFKNIANKASVTLKKIKIKNQSNAILVAVLIFVFFFKKSRNRLKSTRYRNRFLFYSSTAQRYLAGRDSFFPTLNFRAYVVCSIDAEIGMDRAWPNPKAFFP